jgi:Ni2+-binding GTPase involved in maturation of urease and hydrogenase
MKTTTLIIAGGFLGAGKTTLLQNAARKFIDRGLRVGVITNDQAPELVDSEILSLGGLSVAEVSGSCFCCNFNGFTDAIQKIRSEIAADVIIAEPVGSCADLSATIMQPLKQYWNREVRTAPLSVLADPARLGSILDGGDGGLHPDAAYIYRKQLEESDMIVVTKSDLLSAEELAELKARTATAYPASEVLSLSALTGEGLDAWLERVMTPGDAGKKLVDMDYDTYANGEAVLGWLNGTLYLRGKDTDWDEFTRRLVAEMARRFDAEHLPVGHVKVIVENGTHFSTGNITGGAQTMTVRPGAGHGHDARVIINARVETSPEKLDRMTRETIDKVVDGGYDTEVVAWRYLQPGRPNPTHRFSEVV